MIRSSIWSINRRPTLAVSAHDELIVRDDARLQALSGASSSTTSPSSPRKALSRATRTQAFARTIIPHNTDDTRPRSQRDKIRQHVRRAAEVR